MPLPPPDQDLWSKIKTAVVDTISTLNLDGAETRVVSQIDLDGDQLNLPGFPCVVVTTAGLTEEFLAGDTALAEYDWPVGVFIVDRESKKVHQNEPQYLRWRKLIGEAFHQKKLPAVPQVAGGRVFPRMIFDPRLPQYQQVRSSLLLKFSIWESRGKPGY